MRDGKPVIATSYSGTRISPLRTAASWCDTSWSDRPGSLPLRDWERVGGSERASPERAHELRGRQSVGGASRRFACGAARAGDPLAGANRPRHCDRVAQLRFEADLPAFVRHLSGNSAAPAPARAATPDAEQDPTDAQHRVSIFVDLTSCRSAELARFVEDVLSIGSLACEICLIVSSRLDPDVIDTAMSYRGSDARIKVRPLGMPSTRSRLCNPSPRSPSARGRFFWFRIPPSRRTTISNASARRSAPGPGPTSLSPPGFPGRRRPCCSLIALACGHSARGAGSRRARRMLSRPSDVLLKLAFGTRTGRSGRSSWPARSRRSEGSQTSRAARAPGACPLGCWLLAAAEHPDDVVLLFAIVIDHVDSPDQTIDQFILGRPVLIDRHDLADNRSITSSFARRSASTASRSAHRRSISRSREAVSFASRCAFRPASSIPCAAHASLRNSTILISRGSNRTRKRSICCPPRRESDMRVQLGVGRRPLVHFVTEGRRGIVDEAPFIGMASFV